MSDLYHIDIGPLSTGRLYAPDPRDSNFLMSTQLPTDIPPDKIRTYKYWYSYKHHLYQNGYPHCVGYSLTHYCLDAPITAPINFTPDQLYWAANKRDGFSLPHDGTTVRAAAQVLQEWGLIGNYYWAQSISDLKTCILYKCPFVVGTLWFPGMSNPDSKHIMHLTGNSGNMGHAYEIDGYNANTGYFRAKNNWSRRWAKGGYAYIHEDDLDWLVFAADGEAMIATEVQR